MLKSDWFKGLKDAEKCIQEEGLKNAYNRYKFHYESDYWQGWIACCRHYAVNELALLEYI